MHDISRITEISISTTSTQPLEGTVRISTSTSSLQFELNEEVAHSLCTHLDRFLTQGLPLPKDRPRS